MTKLNYSTRVWTIPAIAVLLLLSIAGFYSCQKNKTTAEAEPVAELKINGSDRLYSVANVYYTKDGKSVEAWFFESPQIFEFSATGKNAKANFEVLKSAKENNVPVNLRLVSKTKTLVDVVIPSTEEQRATFKAAMAKREMATAVPSPEEVAQSGTSSLTAVVPSMAVLNTIFNKIKNDCCTLPGPYTYGQCIPFQYVADGCYARAHKMRQIIESFYGYTSYKVFNYACNQSNTLAVSATLWGNNCCVRWWYHVASYVYVQVGASQVAYLLDPAMFTGPVTIATWLNAQKNVGCGYPGTAHNQVYYSSNAYVPSSISNCVMTPTADNTYTAANATCSAYSGWFGCF